MRIAVCRPMVPFVYGGAEVVADTLVDELRARGHEVELIALPFVWDGRGCSTTALQWRLVDLGGSEAEAGRARDRHEVPLLRDPPPEQGRLARPPVPPGLRLRPRRVPASSPSRRSTARRGRRSSGSTGSRSARRRRSSPSPGNVADRLKRYSGLDATVLPPPPQKLDYRTAEYDGFVLSVNRLDRYKRIDLLIDAAKADPALRVVIVGDGPDRGRLEKLASGENGRIEFTGRVDGDELADLYARCLAVYYAPVDEDYGMVPYEAFLSGQAGRDDRRRGRAARGRPRRRDRRRRRARARPRSPAPARTSSPTSTRRASLGEAGKAVAERITWDACIDALLS